MSSVSVFVRVRPDLTPFRSLEIVSPTTLRVEDTSIYSSPMVSEFSFSGVIAADQDAGHHILPLLQAGSRDTLIIGYGHSGSGKTFTIFGPGGILDTLCSDCLEFDATCVSFCEVYNEKVLDLLSRRRTMDRPLPVQEDVDHHVVVKGLTAVQVSSSDELYAVVDVGLRNRVVSTNAVHAHSSRSHGIVKITSSDRVFWLVDLAGSERIRSSLNTTQNKQTALEINGIHKSLHALRRCIKGLEGKRSRAFIPTRSSVLTRILFSTTVSKCILIACVSPDRSCVSETLSTLEFASSSRSAGPWSLATRPKRTDKELDLLRYALAKLKQELHYERSRRMQLEAEISRSCSPVMVHSGFALGGSAGTIKRLSSDAEEGDETPPALLRITPVAKVERSGWADESIKLSRHGPNVSTTFDQPSVIGTSCDDSVLSQTWRHLQYDAILQRCWQETTGG